MKKILLLGLLPSVVDLSQMPGLTEVERLVNVVHEHAPRAKICFNTRPDDTRESVLRWIEAPATATTATTA